MHPDPPADRKYGWNIRIAESPKKSFDDQYLDELKALRDPSYVPEQEPENFPIVLNGRIYSPGLWNSIQEQLHANNSDL